MTSNKRVREDDHFSRENLIISVRDIKRHTLRIRQVRINPL